MKIQYKTALLIFAVGIVSLSVISTVYYVYNYRDSIQKELQVLESLSQETAQHIQTHLEEKATTAITISSAPILRDTLRNSNVEFAGLPSNLRQKKIKGLNKKWMATKDATDPFIQTHMINPAADYLRQQQELFPDLYGEIFLTNRFGVMIATTGKLTTLAHAHKYWWIAGYDDGQGRIFFDDRGFDTSVEGYVLGVVVPVRDENEIVGILKCNVNIQGPLSHIVETFILKKHGIAKIIRSGGMVVVEPGKEPLSTKIPEDIAKSVHREKTQSKITIENSKKELFVITPIIMTMGSEKYGFGGSYESIDHIKGNTGEGWHVGIFRDQRKLDIITARATRMLIMTGILFTLIISAFALILGKKIAKPVEILVDATKRIGEGHFESRLAISSKDEIGMLAESFNSMADSLQKEINERIRASKQLKSIEWLLESTLSQYSPGLKFSPPYGNLVELNTNRLILDSVGEEVLKDIVGDFLDLLDTSSAIYEKNGDYALGIFSSGWCKLLDNASRNLCQTNDNQEALNSGAWLCHESCWTDASRVAIETGQPVDIECNGGIHLYAVPIFTGQEVIGAINFGYGNPPSDRQKLEEIADKYKIKIEDLLKEAAAYETRPKYILDIARKRLFVAARLIGAIVDRKKAEKLVQEAYNDMEQQVKDRTKQLEDANSELVSEVTERKRIEEKLREYAEKQITLLGEVNHRVKNNLTAIISMLHQEEDRAEYEGKKEYSGRLAEVVGRVSGLLTVHSLLSSAMWEPLSLAHLCQNIIKESLKGVHADKSIRVNISPSDVLVDSDQAHYLTIVLNELTTNSMKYVLQDRDTANIQVSIHHQDDSIHLIYHDDGPGYPESILHGEVPSICFGFKLITGIVRKSLQGNIELLNDNGAKTQIIFPRMTEKSENEMG